MGNIPYTDLYESLDICPQAKEFEHIHIIRYESSVYYANVEIFLKKIVKLSMVNPVEVAARIAYKRSEYEKKIEALRLQRVKNFFFYFDQNIIVIKMLKYF